MSHVVHHLGRGVVVFAEVRLFVLTSIADTHRVSDVIMRMDLFNVGRNRSKGFNDTTTVFFHLRSDAQNATQKAVKIYSIKRTSFVLHRYS